MPEHASHPVFARVYAKVAETSKRRGGAEHRHRLLAGLSRRRPGARLLGVLDGARWTETDAQAESKADDPAQVAIG